MLGVMANQEYIVFDKVLAPSYLQVIFRGTYWIRSWSLLQKEDRQMIKMDCRNIETNAMEVFPRHGWRFNNRIDFRCVLETCHPRFSNENQALVICVPRKCTHKTTEQKYQKTMLYSGKHTYINTYNYQSIAERLLNFSSGSILLRDG